MTTVQSEGLIGFNETFFLHVQRDDMEAIPGYLSLHQTAELMTLKWTPNQLMNGNVGELDSEKRLAQKIQPAEAREGLNSPSETHALLLINRHFTISSFPQRVLGLRYDNSFGGDRVSPLSPARYDPPLSMLSVWEF